MAKALEGLHAAGMGDTAQSVTVRHPDSDQLVRQWALLRLLAHSRRSLSVKELADQLVTSKATIQRDLATLNRDFAVIEETVGKQKKAYRIDESIRALETIQFGTMELLAMHSAMSGLSALAGTPFHDDLRSVMTKIRGFLSPRHNGGLDAMSRVFLPHARGHVDHSAQSELIDDLVDAIAQRRVCRVVYHAAWRGTTREHHVRPLRLVWHRSSLYLFCCRVGKSEITTLAVQRIRELAASGEVFAAPRVDVEAHVGKAFGIFVGDGEQDVEITFAPEIAWRVQERVFHPDEKKTVLPDGRLHYQLRSSAQWEIIPWVQTFGAMAELVKPVAWRDALREQVAELAKIYKA